MTKTLIDVDDTLMAEAMRISGHTTKKATVAEALEQMVRKARTLSYLDLLSTGVVDDLNDPEVIEQAQR